MATAGPNFTYSGATFRQRFGSRSVACTKVTPPKESVKTEMVRRLGEMVAEVRTVGIYETDGGSVEMEAAVFSTQVLPYVTLTGWSQFEFVVTCVQRHPLVGGVYVQHWDRCRFAGIEQEAIEAAEKANKLTLPVSVIEVFHAGIDNVLKSLALHPGPPSPLVSDFRF